VRRAPDWHERIRETISQLQVSVGQAQERESHRVYAVAEGAPLIPKQPPGTVPPQPLPVVFEAEVINLPTPTGRPGRRPVTRDSESAGQRAALAQREHRSGHDGERLRPTGATGRVPLESEFRLPDHAIVSLHRSETLAGDDEQAR
jgi:hypothetical protein